MVFIHQLWKMFYILRENMHNVRNFQEIPNENRKTVKCGTETISNRTPFLWANLPNEYKLAVSLHGFKVNKPVYIANHTYRFCGQYAVMLV